MKSFLSRKEENFRKGPFVRSFFLLFLFIMIALSSLSNAAQIISIQPANNTLLSPLRSSVQVNLTTNETAQCYYATDPAMTNKQSFALTNALVHQQTFSLTAGTRYDYYYQCESANDPNQTVYHHFTTDDALTISNTATETGGTTANLSFSTNRNANFTLAYGTVQQQDWHDYPLQSNDYGNTQTVTFAVTGLSEQTTYYYTLIANDTWGSEKTFNGSFTTEDRTAPLILSLQNSSTETSITISWTTNEQANCTIMYGTTSALGSTSSLARATDFSKTVSGYDPETTIYWKVRCEDTAGNHNETPLKSGKTQEDTTPPSITIVEPHGTVSDDDVQVKVTTNEPATCRYAQTEKSYDEMTSITTQLSTTHNVTLENLPNAKYTYWISCRDAKQNEKTLSFSFTVNQTIINETYYGDNIGNPHPYEPHEPQQESPRFLTLTYNFTNISSATNQRINQEGFILKEFTLYPDQFYTKVTATIRRLYDLTEVNDVQQIIYQAYEITIDPPLSYQIGFSVSKIWLKHHDALPDHIRIYTYTNYRWQPLKPTKAYENSRTLYYVVSGMHNGYVIIALDKDAVLQYQLQQTLLAKQEPKTTTTQTITTTTTTTTRKKPEPKATQIPLRPETLLASPQQIDQKSPSFFIAMGVFFFALFGSIVSGIVILKKIRKEKPKQEKTLFPSKQEFVEEVREIKQEVKQEIDKAESWLDNLVEEILVGDGITPEFEKEQQQKKTKEEKTKKAIEEAENIDHLLEEDQEEKKSRHENTMNDMMKEKQLESKQEETLRALEAVKEELLAEQQAIETIEEKLRHDESTINKIQKQSVQLQKLNTKLLLTFITQSLHQGFSPEKIKNVLMKKGYTEQEITSAMKQAETNLLNKIKQKKLDIVYEHVLKLTIQKMKEQGKSKETIIQYLKEHHIPLSLIQKLIKE